MWMRPHRIVRPVASIVLVALATLVLLLGIVANWARTQIYDGDAFADHAVQALDSEAVRAALTDAIVDQIIEVGPPEAISIRPLIQFVTSTVVDTQAFRDIYRDSVRDLHSDIFEGANEEPVLALTLVDAMIVITGFMEQAYPEVSNQLPEDLNNTLIGLREQRAASSAAALGDSIGYLSAGLPLVAAALYGAGLWVAPVRRRAVLYIGIGLVAAGILLVGARSLAEEVAIPRAPFEDTRVAEALWDAYTGSLQGWAVLAGGAGLALTVGATGSRRRVDVRRQLELARQGLAYTPASTWGKSVRAVSFIVVGFLVLRQPGQALEIVMLGLGAYALYYGMSELIWLAGPARPAEAPPEPAGEPWRRAARRIAVRGGALAGLLVTGIVALFVTYQALQTAGGEATAAPTAERCNGHAELCDRRLDEVTLLGTHNSMSAASEPGWFMAQQLQGIPSQLESGVRALLIDTWYGYDTGRGIRTAERDIALEKLPPGQYGEEVHQAATRLMDAIGPIPSNAPRGTYLCHSFCELGATPLQRALGEINAFLDQNPGEVIVINIQDTASPEDTAKAFIGSGLIGRVYHHEQGEPFPTLGEMVEADERVVVLVDEQGGGNDWYLPAYEFLQETPYTFRSREEFSCEPNRGDDDNPLFQVNHWVSTAIPLASQARTINSFEVLYERVRECEEQRGKRTNLVNVNFSELGDAHRVVDVLNGVGAPPEEYVEEAEPPEGEGADGDHQPADGGE